MAVKKTHHKPSTTPKKRTVKRAKKAVAKRKKTHTRKRSMLHDAGARSFESFATILLGGTGGGLIRTHNKLLEGTLTSKQRAISGGILTFLTGLFGADRLAAGMAGAVVYEVLDQKLLAEDDDEDMQDAEFTDAEVLEEMPEYLSNDGHVLLQDANGDLQYLADMKPSIYAPWQRPVYD